MNITGIITTLNEEQNIVECIQSLQKICNEIIVVDSFSTDNTIFLAEQLGAKVFKQTYLGDGIQKNFGLQFASNKWIFSLDADERITDELASIINTLDITNSTFDAYAVGRRNYIGSRWIKCCRWYPDYCTRLYNKERTQFTDTKEHACVLSNNVCKLKADILHYSFKNIGELFGKKERDYPTRSAKIMYCKGKRANAFTPIMHFCSAFFTKYFLHGGVFGGVDGFTISISSACSTYQKYARLLEFQRDEKVRQTENFDNVW